MSKEILNISKDGKVNKIQFNTIPLKIELYKNIYEMVMEYRTTHCPDLNLSETINKILFNGIN